MNSYYCSFCDIILDSTFYMCYKFHICCTSCRLLGGFCPDCHVMQILCCSLRLYEMSPKGPLFDKVGGKGPIIALPDVDISNKELCYRCPSCESNETVTSRLFNCPDCGRFISNLWLVEHYQRDHPNTHVCPLPPGGCLSFKMKLSDVELGKVKRLQVMKIISTDWMNQSTNYLQSESLDDKILFIMATKTTYFKSKTALLLWLTSCFHACLMTYTIEARGEKNNLASAMYTGNPIGPKVMEEITKGTMKSESTGQYLSIKESLITAFESQGDGVIINVLVYNNN